MAKRVLRRCSCSDTAKVQYTSGVTRCNEIAPLDFVFSHFLTVLVPATPFKQHTLTLPWCVSPCTPMNLSSTCVRCPSQTFHESFNARHEGSVTGLSRCTL